MESSFQTSGPFHISTPSSTSAALAVGDRKPERRSRSPSHSSSSQALRPDEDWTKISDLAERRRIQNRIAQRNYRKKLKRRLEELEKRAGSSPPSDSNSPPPLQTSPLLSTDALPEVEEHSSLPEVSKDAMVDPILVQSSYPPFTYSRPSKPSESNLDVFQQHSISEAAYIPVTKPTCDATFASYGVGWSGMCAQETLPDGSIPLSGFYDPTLPVPETAAAAAGNHFFSNLDGTIDPSLYDPAMISPPLTGKLSFATPHQAYGDVIPLPEMRDRIMHLIATGQIDEEELYRDFGFMADGVWSNGHWNSGKGYELSEKFAQKYGGKLGSAAAPQLYSDEDAEGIIDMDVFVKPELMGEESLWADSWQRADAPLRRETVLSQ